MENAGILAPFSYLSHDQGCCAPQGITAFSAPPPHHDISSGNLCILIGAVHSFMVYFYHVIFGFKSTISTGCFWLVLPTLCSFFYLWITAPNVSFLCYFGSYILIYYYFLHTLVQWFSTTEIPLTIREAWPCLEASLGVTIMAGEFGESILSWSGFSRQIEVIGYNIYRYVYIYSGEGNGNPLQYPCLENPTDRGTWYPTVHGVAKRHDWVT